ncbi:hypothetical protein PV708_36280 [Streptomyces sp. ME02-6977A]|nr:MULTISPECIES: hypothetical protein [unclassified Streptomyces]MDX3345954.1 hypothetical protein [Streptomyces sp. ME02-6979A]MDX3411629.1 hypothetical protein [Streptomyces sp. ME02-6977A]
MEYKLGAPGPAQSEYLYHFTDRLGDRPDWVPEEIRSMKGADRLEAILWEEQFRAFPPFGTADPGASGKRCVCFSECSPEQMAFLVQGWRFRPWGLVTTREVVNGLGGGAVAYVPPEVQMRFRKYRLGHWAVSTESENSWMHEREWRLPVSSPAESVTLPAVTAILVADAGWRPRRRAVAWTDGESGDPLAGSGGNPFAVPFEDYPRLWRETPVWVWDQEAERVVQYEPGALC